MRFSPRAVGLASALVTVLIWTAFIVIARASAQRTLSPFDIAFLRIVGASVVLMPWALWRARRERRSPAGFSGSLGGLSPLPLRPTLVLGLFGGLAYAVLAYSGFFFAPAAHGSVLMPGSLPLWASLLSIWLLGDRPPAARVFGLGLILLGDLLVGGASLLGALSGQGTVWKGDLLFMAASSCWATYSVLVRRTGADAVRATMAVTALALLSFVPVFALLTQSGLLPTRLGSAPWGEIVFQLLFQGGDLGHRLHAHDPILRSGAFHHDHGPGAGPVGPGRGLAAGRAHVLEPDAGPGPGHGGHCSRRAAVAAGRVAATFFQAGQRPALNPFPDYEFSCF